MSYDVKILPTFRHTITVLNKRDGRDSPYHLDAWKKTVLRQCAWKQTETQSQPGRLSDAVEINKGEDYLVRVPPSTEYQPYSAWKDTMEGFTFSPGDYVIKGEITDEVTAETVQSIVSQHRPDAFEVRLFRDNTGTGYLDHYRLEGK